MSGYYKSINRKCVIVINKGQEKGNTTNQTGTQPGNTKRNKQELRFAPFSLRIENNNEYDKAQDKKERDSWGRTETKTSIIREAFGPCLLLGKSMGALGFVQTICFSASYTGEFYKLVCV